MLNKIKFTYHEADKQEGLFTPYHTLFKCKIKIDGLQYSFDYQCNVSLREPNLLDCLESLMLDASCYECYDFVEFIREFGYDAKQAEKAYKSCKKTSKALNRLFTYEEMEEIRKELEEEGF